MSLGEKWQVAQQYFYFTDKCSYVFWAIVLSLLIRAILGVFSAWHLHHVEGLKFWEAFWGAIKGSLPGPRDLRERSDFLMPFFLGILELLGYPILIATDQLNIIGVWIGFKTVAQWSTWKIQRFTFNRFLLGNALVVAASYVLSETLLHR